MLRSVWFGVLLSGIASSASAAVWTVDDSGGQDFTTIQAAVNAASSGDVILVYPGSYAGFTVASKSLGILGLPVVGGAKPTVGKSAIQSIQDATIAGLTINGLNVETAFGTVMIDDVATKAFTCEPGLRLKDCFRAIVNRSTLEGKTGDIACETTGLYLENSVVNLSSCTVRGGKGGSDGNCFGFDGAPGVTIQGDAELLMAQTSVFGGDGGSALFDCGQGGDGAPAIRFTSFGGKCVVRGNSSTLLDGGSQGCALDCGDAAQYVADGMGTLTMSGVIATPSAYGPSVSGSIPIPAQPFMTLSGTDVPAATKTLSVFGPVGSSHLVYLTLGMPDPFKSPAQLDGWYYLALPGPVVVFSMTGAGQNTASSVAFALPGSFAGLEGLIATFQGSAQGMGAGGKWLALNAVSLVIR